MLAETVAVSFTLNGSAVAVTIEPRELLVTVLRDRLRMLGTHVGCDTTNCGCCTVLLDGNAVKSCTIFAVMVAGRSIVTIEGLADGGGQTLLQRMFAEEHALQCGYCTPGLLLCATDLLAHTPQPTEAEIKSALAGCLCRCTGYAPVVRAVQRASGQTPTPSHVVHEEDAR
jgi:carbon-monoxide dehydrogenase small subunit